ncbi:MAG: hypothetical protein JNM98_07760 [Rhodocyclaceae bacterium]|nr:hypothetical protein [Rhodocyclaceae bacterium]
MKLALPLSLLVALAGCQGMTGTYPRTNSLIPSASVQVTESYAVSLDKLVHIAGTAYLLYLVVDPFAPNWQIEQAKLSEDQYYLSMRMKRFHTGGDGESLQVVRRRAEQLARGGGFAGYEIQQYNEGVESGLIAQRVSEATILLVRGLQ